MKKVSAILIIILLSAGCAPLQQDHNLEVFLNLPRKNLARSSILIFNFKEPAYANGAGVLAAELFHSRLLKTKKFKITGLSTDSPWSRLGESEEDRILYLLDDNKAQDYDYILVGELKDFYYGGINISRVKMKVRIIEVKSKTTIFMAENANADYGKAPQYLMNTQLTKKAKSPQFLAEKMVKELVNEI